MVKERPFGIASIYSGTVAGAVGYRLYEQNSGQLQSLIDLIAEEQMS